MSAVQHKCLLVSAAFHSALLGLLVLGPAYTAPRPPVDDLPLLDFVPTRLVDEAFFGGGSPGPRTPPAPAPAQPATPPALPRVAAPPSAPESPRPEPSRPPREEGIDLNPPAPPQPAPAARRVIQPNLKPVTQRSASQAGSERAEDRAAERPPRSSGPARWSQSVGRAMSSLRDGLSSSTRIEGVGPGSGDGTGGESYANYAQFVKTFYDRSWIRPLEIQDRSLTVRARVVIARDGRVISSRIEKPSGHSVLDQSVARVLERVTFVAPFPEGARESERTYRIHFVLNADALTG
ncbi:MAG TPA: cell envelope integrity protein TolA [Candidatus Paceibacterota bacterium]|nr:TonB family protein [Verrucomicrobiota bacterium]HOX03557.1 cell envelope integrity protein TolA [Verrucomicrobiota bacterium]HRZ46446.1 cell envelope integrity protein TolA [Candidatus Paceibacterota bacterium]